MEQMKEVQITMHEVYQNKTGNDANNSSHESQGISKVNLQT